MKNIYRYFVEIPNVDISLPFSIEKGCYYFDIEITDNKVLAPYIKTKIKAIVYTLTKIELDTIIFKEIHSL